MSSREDAVAALLGAVLLYGEPALDVLVDERVQPRHLPDRAGRMLDAALTVRADGAIDPGIVKAQLEPEAAAGKHPWRDVLDMRASVDLASAGPIPELGSLRSYCRIVREHAWWEHAIRQLHNAGDALDRRDRDSLIAAVAAVDSLDEPARVAGAGQVERFLAWYDSEQRGIPLPFGELTEGVGGGLQAGEVTMLGGWPGMGKTLFAKDIMLAATEAGARCHDYANEQFGPRRTARLVSSLTGISASKIRRRELTADEWSRVVAVFNRGLPYETTPTPGWMAEDYARELRRHKWDVAVVDTVTNLPYSQTDEWDRACGLLADAAAQAGTQLILICQLNLERSKGTLRLPPVGRDLRSTGAWYQRAKVVMFVHCDQELREEIPVTLPEGHIRVDKANDGDAEHGFVQVYRNYRWARFDRLVPMPERTAVAA